MLQERILRRLERDRCPFRVAVYAGSDPDLGKLIEVHAFEVPGNSCAAVSRRLNHLLWGVDQEANVVAGAYGVDESPSRQVELPDDVIWYEPNGEVLPVVEYVASPTAAVREGKPPSRPAPGA
jgi:hypothetical protein